MLGKLGGAEAPGLVAPDAAKKDEPRGLAGDAGLKVGQETTGSSPDSPGYGDGPQTPPVDADLPAFEALRTAAARDGWELTRVVAHGRPIYLLARLKFSADFHELADLRQFLASRGVRP